MSKYINTSKISSSNVLKTIFYVIGFVTGIPNVFMLLFALFGNWEGKNDDMGVNIAIIIFFALITAGSAAFIVIAAKTGKKISRTKFYASIFESDNDGIVDKQELIDQTGMQIFDIMKELDVLITKNYLHNCVLRRGSDPAVVLTVENSVTGILETVGVKCPACGGTMEIRKGATTTCEYCGAVVKG